jgi:Zn-dependent protease/CBS domain-containing protein
MRATWRIGSLFGIPLYIDSSWFLILAFVTLIDASDISESGLSGNAPWLGWLTALLMALLLFVSVLLHELGHSLVARAQGITVHSITLFLFGGIASIDRESKTPAGALLVAIAGPLVSLSLSGVFFALAQGLREASLLGFLTSDLGRINLVLALFNLIPGLPLDGGQVLKALVWKLTGDRFKGVRWAAASGQWLGWFGITTGLFFFLLAGQISALWLVFIGWFVLRSANAYSQLTLLQESLLTLMAADAMTGDFRVVNAHLTLREFAETYLLSDSGAAVPYYAASEGRYRGLVKIQDVRAADRAQWDTQRLTDIARPLTDIPSVPEKTPLIEVIRQLEETGDRSMTVLSPAGAVAGVIDRGDLVKAIATHQSLSIPDAEIKRIKSEGTYPSYLQLPTIARGLLSE